MKKGVGLDPELESEVRIRGSGSAPKCHGTQYWKKVLSIEKYLAAESGVIRKGRGAEIWANMPILHPVTPVRGKYLWGMAVKKELVAIFSLFPCLYFSLSLPLSPILFSYRLSF